MVIALGKNAVIVEANPEERAPEPYEVSKVIHGDQQPSPPSHLVRPYDGQLEATYSLDQLQKLREDEHEEDKEHQAHDPNDELERHGQVGLKEFWMLLEIFTTGNKLKTPQPLHERLHGLRIPVFLNKAPLHNFPSCVRLAHKTEERGQKGEKEAQREPNHVHALVTAEERLERQDHTSLGPTLHSRQVIDRVLGHAIGEPSVDELRSIATEHLLQTTGCVLDLAALVEGASLYQLKNLALAFGIPHSPLLLLPHQLRTPLIIDCMPDHPRAICAA
mmetsp:Transcript_37157/g.85860  ORF Transcript_37157/g.85860 Transcript_37157/m.85860 type:complete len:276 (-) Transcript_37157:2999-3826(-)